MCIIPGKQKRKPEVNKMLQYACCLTFLFTVCFAATGTPHLNGTGAYIPVLRNGKTVYMTEELARKLQEETETWHWMPYLKTKIKQEGLVVSEADCPSKGSLGSFPESIFTDDQLRQGGVIMYIFFAMCSFTLVAYVCNDYFLPSVEIMCDKLKIPQNVAAATFMSVATSCPEFFVNTVSTFITKSDMGIGTIVGSAIFNALGVAAVGGIAAVRPISIDKRPVTRDVIIYMINVTVLVVIVWDGQVVWFEALVLAILYVLYFIVMFNSRTVFHVYDYLAGLVCKKRNSLDLLQESVPSSAVTDSRDKFTFEAETDAEPPKKKPVIHVKGVELVNKNSVERKKSEDASPVDSIWRYPREKVAALQVLFLLSWPFRFILSITVPNPEKHERLFLVSFLMCIVWIGFNSYVVSWTMTVIGHTFYIPDSVMGMTFMAFGSCLPEACAIFIMSRRGEGGMGVSNALGGNSLAILFALGLPWLIRTLVLVTSGDEDPVVRINSDGIDFVVGSLLVAVVCLWFTLFFGHFTLRPSLGAVLLALYAIFVTFVILVEMGIIINIAKLC